MPVAPRPVGEASIELGQQASSSGAYDRSLGVIIVAAGEGRRMAGVDKIFSRLLGLPLIVHTVEALAACDFVKSLVLVLAPDRVELGRSLARERGWRKVTSVRQGGPRRQDSVRLGLEHLPPCPWVAVHDGARPCIRPELLEWGVEAARETGASVAAVPAKDTIKAVSSLNMVEATPSRDRLWMVQTPQVFRYELLLQAHRLCQETVTDDSTMVESLGHKVKVFMGDYGNLKVTTPEDLTVAEAIIRERLRPLSPKPEGKASDGYRWPQE